MIKKLFGMFLCFFLVFSITGCQLINRIPIEIDANQFTTAMENYDFKVYDNTKTLNSDFVTKNLIAIKNEKQIEFYQFKNEDDCKKSYESTRNKIESKLYKNSCNNSKKVLYSGKNRKSYGLLYIQY